MAKTAKKTTTAAGAKKAALKKSGGRKSTGETININTPPKKKWSTVTARYSIKKEGFYTMNPYAHGPKKKIDIVLHKGGMPSKDAQPQVSLLLLGGKALSVQWTTSENRFSQLQALAQGIPRDSSGFLGYSNTMQEVKKVGVVATNRFFRGPPQIIQLGVECTGSPKVKQHPVLTKEKVFYKVRTMFSSTLCTFAR